jgi:hypothetical protein
VITDNTLDPNETRDKAFDWGPQLAVLAPGETIASAEVLIVDKAGVTATNATVVATTHTDTTVTVRLSGVTGTEVYLLCRVTTSTSEILDDTWRLFVTNH